MEEPSTLPRHPFSSMGIMDTNEGKEMTHKIMDHALRIVETVSFPLGSPRRTPIPQDYKSCNIPLTISKCTGNRGISCLSSGFLY